jgi:hypothetical protein
MLSQYTPNSRLVSANAWIFSSGHPSMKKSVVERIQGPLGFALLNTSRTRFAMGRRVADASVNIGDHKTPYFS